MSSPLVQKQHHPLVQQPCRWRAAHGAKPSVALVQYFPEQQITADAWESVRTGLYRAGFFSFQKLEIYKSIDLYLFFHKCTQHVGFRHAVELGFLACFFCLLEITCDCLIFIFFKPLLSSKLMLLWKSLGIIGVIPDQ